MIPFLLAVMWSQEDCQVADRALTLSRAKQTIKAGRLAEAEEILRMACEGPNADVFELLGLVQLGQQRPIEAAESFRKAVVQEPDRISSWYYRGLVEESCGRLTEAAQFYREAVDRDPGDYLSRIHLGTALLMAGQLDRAEEQLLAASQSRLTASEPHRLLSRLALVRDNLAVAKREAIIAVRIDTASAPAHYQLGQVLARTGDSALAESEFNEMRRLALLGKRSEGTQPDGH